MLYFFTSPQLLEILSKAFFAYFLYLSTEFINTASLLSLWTILFFDLVNFFVILILLSVSIFRQ